MKATLQDDKVILEFNIGSYDKNTIDFLTNIELSQKSKATEEDINILSEEITETWWKANKNRFINEA
ncbi:MAG: hypothetical protein M1478_05280 [Deltaproteobacteria bacterium]|jgi:hypothetical protein|nr:hypothetical protein [Deltaproteobacteria bacterium]MCL5880228.1 hypothetical protein [Deltaproteobacteria bacterium]